MKHVAKSFHCDSQTFALIQIVNEMLQRHKQFTSSSFMSNAQMTNSTSLWTNSTKSITFNSISFFFIVLDNNRKWSCLPQMLGHRKWTKTSWWQFCSDQLYQIKRHEIQFFRINFLTTFIRHLRTKHNHFRRWNTFEKKVLASCKLLSSRAYYAMPWIY